MYFHPVLVAIVFFSISHVGAFAEGINMPDPSKFDVRGFHLGMTFQAAKDLLSKYDIDNRMTERYGFGSHEGFYLLETRFKNDDGAEESYEIHFTCDDLGKRLYEITYTIEHNILVNPDLFLKKVEHKYGKYTNCCKKNDTLYYNWGFAQSDLDCDFLASWNYPKNKSVLQFRVRLEPDVIEPSKNHSVTALHYTMALSVQEMMS